MGCPEEKDLDPSPLLGQAVHFCSVARILKSWQLERALNPLCFVYFSCCLWAVWSLLLCFFSVLSFHFPLDATIFHWKFTDIGALCFFIWIHWRWSQNPVLANWVPKWGVQFSLGPALSTRLGHRIEWKIPYCWGRPAQPCVARSACSCFLGAYLRSWYLSPT